MKNDKTDEACPYIFINMWITLFVEVDGFGRDVPFKLMRYIIA
jgi:hypothetical protein